MFALRVCVGGGGGDVDGLKCGVENHHGCECLSSDLAREYGALGRIVGDKYTGVRRQPGMCG